MSVSFIPLDIVSAHPPSQMVAVGQTATLRCLIHNTTIGGSLGWTNGGRAILPEPNRYELSGQGEELTILNVQSSDAGAYYCVLSTITFEDFLSNTSTLSICGKY